MFNSLKNKLKGWFSSSKETLEKETVVETKEDKIIKKAEKLIEKTKQEPPEKIPVKFDLSKREFEPDLDKIKQEAETIKKETEQAKQKEKEIKKFDEAIEKAKKEPGKQLPTKFEVGKQKYEPDLDKIKKEKPKSFFSKLKSTFSYKISEDGFNEIFDDLELLLLENNVALEVVEDIKSKLSKKLIGKEVKQQNLEQEIKQELKNTLNEILIEPDNPLDIIKISKKPFIILFFGINGTGKCVIGESEIQLSDGSLLRIKDLYENAEANKKPIKDGEDHLIRSPGIIVPSLNPKTLKIENKKVSAIWKLKAQKYLYKVTLNNGREIITTPEHPFFTIINGGIEKIKSENLKKGDYVSVNRKAPFGKINNREILERLDESFFVGVKNINSLYKYLKKEFGSLKKAHSILKTKQSFNTFAYYWKKRKIIPIKFYLKFKDLLDATSIQYSGSKPIPLIKFSKELAELTGLILAEGHLNKKTLELTNKDSSIIKRFEYLIKRIFNQKSKNFIDKRGLIRSRITNWSIIRLFNSVFDIPFGKKSDLIKVPELILKADKKSVESFLISYIETEGHIMADYRTIEISTSSSEMAKDLAHLFTKLGIIATIKKKENKEFPSYKIYINGYNKINRISKLRFYTKKSIDKIKHIKNLKNQFEITELIPNSGQLIKKFRLLKKIHQKVLAKSINSTQSLISQYESKTPIPRKNLKLLSKKLKSNYLNLLADSDISWIKIKSIKKIKPKNEWVYDLTIEGNHNFIANDMIIHNTTSIAKIAHFLKKSNLKVVLAAADTFRAASIEQLSEHAEKLKVPIIKHDYNADPAAVGFDAIKYAKNHKIDVVLIDTAGRMHTKANLLEEMKKIERVTKPDLKIFVAESIAGNDATEQAKTFNEAIEIDGTILSKVDVDEKGGTIISVSHATGKPIFYLGIGQELDDLELFNKQKFIESLGL